MAASIAVVGEERNILGFKPFGVDVYSLDRSGEIEDWFRSIVRKNYRLILITDRVARKLKEQIDALWKQDFPVVLTIRGLGEAEGMAFERLRSLVIKAIGTDIFKES
jgi:vacuolar-type H+-ATPase subunit F/Vma7